MANENLSTSNKGIQIMEHFEGVKLKPYLCSADVPTIGIGSTYYENGTPVKLTDPAITKERAYTLFRLTLKKVYEPVVRKAIKVKLTQNQFDALVCLAYNCGSIFDGMADKVNTNPKDKTIWGQFLQYNKVNGERDGKDNDGDGLIDEKGEKREEFGLTRRRNSEAHLYFLDEVDFYLQLLKK